MKKEIYEDLKKWDSTLYNAHRINFVHLNNTEFKELAEYYKKVFNKEITKSQYNCNSCRVKIIKQLAVEYLDHKNKELNSVIETNLTKVVKKGRPKKNNEMVQEEPEPNNIIN